MPSGAEGVGGTRPMQAETVSAAEQKLKSNCALRQWQGPGTMGDLWLGVPLLLSSRGASPFHTLLANRVERCCGSDKRPGTRRSSTRTDGYTMQVHPG